MTPKEFYSLTKNTEFEVSFIKKNGEIRNMKATVERVIPLENSPMGMGYSPTLYNMVSVFDLEKQGYRVIDLSRLISLKVKGEKV